MLCTDETALAAGSPARRRAWRCSPSTWRSARRWVPEGCCMMARGCNGRRMRQPCVSETVRRQRRLCGHRYRRFRRGDQEPGHQGVLLTDNKAGRGHFSRDRSAARRPLLLHMGPSGDVDVIWDPRSSGGVGYRSGNCGERSPRSPTHRESSGGSDTHRMVTHAVFRVVDGPPRLGRMHTPAFRRAVRTLSALTPDFSPTLAEDRPAS